MASEPPVETGCSGWDNSDCEGTPYCPPRCPRFFDKLGTPLLVLAPEAAGVDAEDLVEIYDCGPEGHTMSYPPYRTRDALLRWLEDLMDRARSFVALDGERPVGHALFAPVTGEEPEFAVFVDPDYRGRGIAGELLRQCIVHAAAEGHRALVMHVQENHGAMVRLAESHGFAVAGEADGTEQYALLPLRLSLERSTTVERIGLVAGGPDVSTPA